MGGPEIPEGLPEAGDDSGGGGSRLARDILERPLGRNVVRPVGAVVATAVTFGLVMALAPEDSYVRDLFLDRGWFQYGSTFFFWLALGGLALNHVCHRYEEKAHDRARRILAESGFTTSLTYGEADWVWKKFTEDEDKPFQRSITFGRVRHALRRLLMAQNTQALEDYFRNRSDVDAGELETSYAGIRYLIWLIPTIGFLGTVLGIGLGITEFADLIATAQRFSEIKDSLPQVTRSLGMAFDTTLLALALTSIAVFYMSLLLKKQEHLLAKIDNFCFEDISGLFQEYSSAHDELLKTLRKGVDRICTNVNGNRAAVVHALGDALPASLAKSLADELEARADIICERVADGGTPPSPLIERLRSMTDDSRSIMAALGRQDDVEREILEALRSIGQRLTTLHGDEGVRRELVEALRALNTKLSESGRDDREG